MPLYTNVAITRPTPLSLEDWQPTTGEVLSSAWDAAMASNPMQSMENLLLGREDFSDMSDQDVVDYAAGERANPSRGMALDAQQARIRAAGLDGRVTPDERYSEDALETIITAKQAENANALVAEKATGLQTAAAFGAGLAASFLDPVNIASAFVPVVGEARMLSLLGKAGSFWGRAALRAGEGAASGAVGAAMIEPLVYAGQQAIQADYGMMDSLLNVGFGAAMGAAMQPVAGGVGEFLRNRRGVRHPWEASERTDGSERLRLDFAARQERAFLEANPTADRQKARENALASAALFDARARAREYDTGMTVEDFYQRYGPEFRSSRQEGSADPVVTLQQAAMHRSDAATIDDFVLQSRTLGNDEKTFFHFQTPLELDGKTLPVELGSDQVRHIERRHPEFAEWEKIPEIIEKGEALYLGESRYTGAAAYAYILNDGGMARVVIGSPLKGNAKRKRPGRFVTLTAFRDNGAAVSQWAARYGNAASPSGETRTPPGARGSRASLPSEKASLGPQGDITSPRIAAINAELKEIGIGGKGSSRLSQAAGREGTEPGGVRSQVDFDADGKAVITFFSSADASSAPHELYHIFRRDLADAAAAPDASPRAREMWAKIEEFVGAKPGEAWTRGMEEKFARAGERFLLEGKAPGTALLDVFTRLRQWFLELYADADAAGLEISDGMRKVFNDMLSVPVDKADMEFRHAVGDLATRRWEQEFVDPGAPVDATEEKMRRQTDMEAMQSLEDDARAGMENAAERAAIANQDASLPIMEQAGADLAEADAEIARARKRGEVMQKVMACEAEMGD